uniref:Mitochondrial glutamate carrier 1-like n=1 Tax=Macrostomum lignano TaxID=282301 RepID=A0A1I8IAD9_9PLAT
MATQTQKVDAQPAQFRLLPKVINGAIAGLIGVTCTFPIDLVKTRLQKQQGGTGCTVECSAVNLLLITPEKAIKLVGNDFFRHKLETPSGKLTLPRECLAGGLAGACQIVVTTPMELLKIHGQVAGAAADAAGTPRASTTSVALNLIRERGITGLYKGFGSTFLRDVSFSVIYFPLFAHLNHLGPRKSPDSQDAAFYVSLLAGIVSGATGSFCVTPLDVIKTRLQILKHGDGDVKFNGVIDCFRKTLTNEGVTAFFKGAGCRMAVVAPLFGIAQAVYYVGIAEFLLDKCSFA